MRFQTLTANGPILIAGPCALESRSQLRQSISALKHLGLNAIRASLWKPRTQPGWEGLGWMSLPMLMEETLSQGLMPATEIITSEHAKMVVDALSGLDKGAEILVWLGARNQNHLEQTKIAKILAEGSSGILFMFKNQMWDDERHWIGIYEHIVSAGFPKERLLMCHRGFSPGKMANPNGFRNLPDFEMAMRMKEKTGLKMILDPSHIGGTQDNVFEVMRQAQKFAFDGYIIEVHHEPQQAKTDVKQQLSIEQFEMLLQMVRT